MRAHALLFVLAACGKSADPPSCHDRVQAMAAHLDAPRPGDPSKTPKDIAAALADRMRDCPEGIAAFGKVADIDGDKAAYLRANVPPALEACACKASPEDVGPQLEALLAAWKR